MSEPISPPPDTALRLPHVIPSSLSERPALARLGRNVRQRLLDDPSVQQIPSEHLELFAVGDFFAPEECARMIAIVDAVAQPSTLYDRSDGTDFRTSFSGDVDPADPFIRMMERRIDDLLDIPHEWGETIQGQRYEVGQQFKSHCDYFHANQRYWQIEKRRGGQRSWTAMAYLNAVEDGGATDFGLAGIAIPPQPGALLVWNNMDAKGNPNPWTLHAGTPVVRGTKYIITKWYRSRKWG